MKKKKILLIIFLCLTLFFAGLSTLYIYGMSPKNKTGEIVLFDLKGGTSKIEVAEQLETAGLIRSSLVLKAYLFFNSEMNLQAGIYELNSAMSPKEMLKKIENGDIKNDNISVTLIEGKRLTEFIETISSKLPVSEQTLLNKMSDIEYLTTLINKYWFLDESILNSNIYYPLEGYIFPDTYEFKEHSTVEEVIEKILNHTEQKLNSIKEQIDNQTYSVHELLSMASIIELEAVTESDRAIVSQVIYKRIKNGMGLGMDVTTYYAVKKAMGEGLTLTDLRTVSPYNTSEMNSSMAGKLPVGPICNPSLMSIKAALNPSDTDYLYFFADITTGKVYFSNTYQEHVQVQKEIG